MNDLDGEVRLRLEYDLQFFAKDGPGGEKTEVPTAKKLNDARKEGQVAKSKEIITALMLLALFVVIKFYIGNLGQQMIECFSEFYDLFGKIIGNSEYGMRMVDATGVVSLGLTTVLNMIVPFIALAVVIAILGNALQQKWMVTTKPLQPKLSKISPISGLKRMFNVKQLFEVGKSVAMIAVMCYVIYTTVKDKLGVLYTFYNISLYEALEIVGDIIVDLGIKISAVFLVIGFVDLIYQRHKFKEDMKMTKQEVKDEFKNTEGDPQVKGQIRRRMQQVSRRRMMEALPQADVVITNPTHFAVALKYEANKGQAPVVIAKGADYLAFDIKAKAKEYGIEIVENKPLARILYNNVEIGAQIPPELYQAVAEVLAFVYSLKNNYNMDEGRR
ncbi:MAG: flagellar biosynthesis protein FlhB [[Bacteroides] pectinophilus]|nr:flagellar biosynthesis protein FlhB [[Bacteroides] pectinophilus]